MPRKKDYKKYRKQTIEYNREWAKNNPDKVRKYKKDYLSNNPEKRKASVRKYDKTHRKEHNIYWHKRRAIVNNLKEHFTLLEWETLKEKWQYTCLACGKQEPEIKLTPDHMIPIIKGGENGIDNIQPLCFQCNRRKNTKIIDYRLVVDQQNGLGIQE